MTPEKIRLLFTNFPLVILSQPITNSISINATIPQLYRFLCDSVTLNQSAASMTL